MSAQLRQAVSMELQINAAKYVTYPHIELVADELHLDGENKLLYQAMLFDNDLAANLDNTDHNIVPQ